MRTQGETDKDIYKDIPAMDRDWHAQQGVFPLRSQQRYPQSRHQRLSRRHVAWTAARSCHGRLSQHCACHNPDIDAMD